MYKRFGHDRIWTCITVTGLEPAMSWGVTSGTLSIRSHDALPLSYMADRCQQHLTLCWSLGVASWRAIQMIKTTVIDWFQFWSDRDKNMDQHNLIQKCVNCDMNWTCIPGSFLVRLDLNQHLQRSDLQHLILGYTTASALPIELHSQTNIASQTFRKSKKFAIYDEYNFLSPTGLIDNFSQGNKATK